MKPKNPDIAFLMFKLDAEIAEMNRAQEYITKLKDEIWEKMRDKNISHVCYDGMFSASVRGSSLVVKHRPQMEVEE